MSNQKKETGISVSEKVTNFLSNNRKILVCLFFVILVGFAVYFVTAHFINKSAEKNFALLAEIQQEYADSLSPDSEVSFDKEAFLAKTEELASSSSGFASAKTYQFAGDLYFEDANYEKAIDFYQLAANKSHNSYLEPLMLYTLGACYEQIGNQDKAVESYLASSKKNNFPYKAHAIFSAGRIEETRGNNEVATSYYNEIIENYPYTNWANLAQSRLVYLGIEN